jgi:hypothetical protein
MNLKTEDDYMLSYRGGILSFSRNDSFIYSFDPNLVTSYFHNYIDPKYYCDMMSVRKDQKLKKAFGIDIYDMIIDSMKLLAQDNIYDIRTLHNLYDHKVLMILRIEYMITNNCLDLNMNILDEFIGIKDKMENVWLRCLKMKYNKRQNDKSTYIIIDQLIAIKHLELDLYQSVIDNIIYH